MSVYFKATRPDGTDFHTGTVDYGAALRDGTVVAHPAFCLWAGPSGYLSVATVATDCTGMSWPCRLFAVEPVGEADIYRVLVGPWASVCDWPHEGDEARYGAAS